jgi:hypothetical protein
VRALDGARSKNWNASQVGAQYGANMDQIALRLLVTGANPPPRKPVPNGNGEVTIALADADGGTDVLAVKTRLPCGLPIADNEASGRSSLAKFAALVEAGYNIRRMSVLAIINGGFLAWRRTATGLCC